MIVGFLKDIFGASKTIEKIATEWIETDKEKAEAQAVMIKAVDPNGLMRRDISRKILSLYSFYIVIMCALLGCEFFNFVPSNTNLEIMAGATAKLVDLFLPITGMVSVIVSASFGVHYNNVNKGK